MHNASIEHAEAWTEDVSGNTCTFTELIRQEYTNCCFSAGMVEGDPVDTLYLKWQRGDEYNMLLLRPDEMAAIAWCATGVLWSDAMVKLPQQDEEPDDPVPTN